MMRVKCINSEGCELVAGEYYTVREIKDGFYLLAGFNNNYHFDADRFELAGS